MSPSRIILKVVLALIAANALEVHASVVVRMDLPKLVEVSDSIVQGTVTRVEVTWDPDAKMVYTSARIKIDDRLKGDRSQELTIRQEGGKIGAMTVHVSGSPSFRVGQQMIVFLDSRADGTFNVVGLTQGKYDIVNGAAVSNVSGLELLNETTGRIERPGTSAMLNVDALKARIRGLVK